MRANRKIKNLKRNRILDLSKLVIKIIHNQERESYSCRYKIKSLDLDLDN